MVPSNHETTHFTMETLAHCTVQMTAGTTSSPFASILKKPFILPEIDTCIPVCMLLEIISVFPTVLPFLFRDVCTEFARTLATPITQTSLHEVAIAGNVHLYNSLFTRKDLPPATYCFNSIMTVGSRYPADFFAFSDLPAKNFDEIADKMSYKSLIFLSMNPRADSHELATLLVAKINNLTSQEQYDVLTHVLRSQNMIIVDALIQSPKWTVQPRYNSDVMSVNFDTLMFTITETHLYRSVNLQNIGMFKWYLTKFAIPESTVRAIADSHPEFVDAIRSAGYTV